MVPPRPEEEVLFNVFEPKLVDSLLYAMIEFFNHGTQWGASCPLSPTLLLDLRLEAGYTFAPFGDNWVDEDDDEDEVGLKEKPEDTRYIKKITSK